MIRYPRSMPTRSTRVAVWATERVSAQMIAGRTGTPSPSSSTAPIICPEKETDLDVGGRHGGLRQQVAGGAADRVPPVAGVLLGLAAGPEVGAVGRRHGGHHPALVADQRGLVPGGAEVVRDDHARWYPRWSGFSRTRYPAPSTSTSERMPPARSMIA